MNLKHLDFMILNVYAWHDTESGVNSRQDPFETLDQAANESAAWEDREIDETNQSAARYVPGHSLANRNLALFPGQFIDDQ